MELCPKRSRPLIEVDLDVAQAFSNLKDHMPEAGINKIIQKMRTDLVKISENPIEFQNMRSELEKNGEVQFDSGNWLNEEQRSTFVEQVPEATGTPLPINSVSEFMKTASYIEKHFKRLPIEWEGKYMKHYLQKNRFHQKMRNQITFQEIILHSSAMKSGMQRFIIGGKKSEITCSP